MDNSVLNFYEQLADNYHLIFADWQASVEQQGKILSQLITQHMGELPLTVLDCSCGIGTQAIALALLGYYVHGTDISPNSIQRAQDNARTLGASLTLEVADLRYLAQQVSSQFDVIISCDNALPHLLSDEDLRLAIKNIWAKLKPNGLLLVSIRDYDRLIMSKPSFTVPNIINTPEGKRIIFQIWDWIENSLIYQIHHFIVQEVENQWVTHHNITQYRALLQAELTNFLQEIGFKDITWQVPEISQYYQPIVTARKV